MNDETALKGAASFTENSGGKSGAAQNLLPHRFQPGTSGNPGGRPKKLPISPYLQSQLESEIPTETLSRMKPEYRADFLAIYGVHPTFGQLIAYQLIARAAMGEVSALSALLDRVEGKVNQKTSADSSGDVVFRLIRADV